MTIKSEDKLKKIQNIFNIFKKYIVFVVVFVVLFLSLKPYYQKWTSQNKEDVKKIAKTISITMTQSMEKAYAAGQKDFMNGKVCIKAVKDGNFTHYIWVKSPWDSGKEPTYKIPKEKIK